MITLNEIENYLKNAPKPNKVRLDKCTVIIDPEKFFESQVAELRANTGKARFMPGYKRLLKFYYLIKEYNNE